MYKLETLRRLSPDRPLQAQMRLVSDGASQRVMGMQSPNTHTLDLYIIKLQSLDSILATHSRLLLRPCLLFHSGGSAELIHHR